MKKRKLYFILRSMIPVIFCFIILNKVSSNGVPLRDYPPANRLSDIRKLHKIGMYYHKKGAIYNAVEYFERILKLKPFNQRALYNSACMNALRGKVRKTVTHLMNLFFINPFWKKKLKPGAEKDFRYINSSPLFILYKKYWLAARYNPNNVNSITGKYHGTSIVRDSEHRYSRTRKLNMRIASGALHIFSSTAVGPLFQGEILQASKFGNLILIKAYEKFDTAGDPRPRVIVVELLKLGNNSVKITGGYYKKAKRSKLYIKLSKLNTQDYLKELTGEVFIRKGRWLD